MYVKTQLGQSSSSLLQSKPTTAVFSPVLCVFIVIFVFYLRPSCLQTETSTLSQALCFSTRKALNTARFNRPKVGFNTFLIKLSYISSISLHLLFICIAFVLYLMGNTYWLCNISINLEILLVIVLHRFMAIVVIVLFVVLVCFEINIRILNWIVSSGNWVHSKTTKP